MLCRYALCLFTLAGSVAAQGALDQPVSPELAEAREAWLNGRYEGIFEVIRAEAEAGSPVAQNIMGASLSEQDGSKGLDYDPEAALDWYGKAVAQDYDRAVYNMALFWQEEHPGHGPDYAKAQALAEQAVEMGNPYALNLLGDMAFHGQGQEADAAKAVGYYRRAADLESGPGLREMGYAHYHGNGVPVDMTLARAYMERAVAAGDRKAIPDLAWLYEGNDGVGQDLVKAYLLYRLGVERGVAKAAYELGLFVAWEEYEGFWHDPVKGYGYCLLGVDWGHVLEDGDVAAECETLAEDLTEAQRTTARAFAEAQK